MRRGRILERRVDHVADLARRAFCVASAIGLLPGQPNPFNPSVRLRFQMPYRARAEMNNKALPRIRRQLLPSQNHLIVCWKNYYALFDPYEYTELILSLGEVARRKIAEKSRRMSRQFQDSLADPRSP